MADVFDEIFEEAPVEPAEVLAEQVTEEVVEDQPEPEVETPEEPEQPPEPTPEDEAPKEEARTVPLATFLDQRDELRELRRFKAEREAQTRQQQPMPDPFDDPSGFAAAQQELVEQRLTQERFAMSDMFARQAHGQEAVESAVTWAQERAATDPSFALSYMRQQNPIDWIVRQHRQDDLIKQIGDSPDEWVKRRYAEIMTTAGPAAAPAPFAAASPKQAPAPVKVPRSLATQGAGPSDVREVATGPLAAVDAVFPA